MPLAPRERLTVVTALSDPSSAEPRPRQRPDLAELREDLERADIDLRYRRNQLSPAGPVAGDGRRGASTIQTTTIGTPINASSSDASDEMPPR